MSKLVAVRRLATRSRLSGAVLAECLESVEDNTYDLRVSDFLERQDYDHASFAIGLERPASDWYLDLRAEVRAMQARAIASGKSERQRHDNFDREFYARCLELLPMTYYDATRADAWDYLTWYVLLDVAVWRFKGHPDRIVYNVSRHVYARWWIRAHVVSSGNHPEPLDLLDADWEVVFERPRLFHNDAIANAALAVLDSARRNRTGTSPARSSQVRPWIGAVLRTYSQNVLDGYTEEELKIFFQEIWDLQQQD